MGYIFWMLGAVVFGYIIWDIFRNKEDLKEDNVKRSLLRIREQVESAGVKDIIIGLLFFAVAMFIVRGAVFMQYQMQICEFEDQGVPTHVPGLGGYLVDIREKNDFSAFQDGFIVEQGRSYNYYRRYWNDRGGKPPWQGAVCKWSFEGLGQLEKDIKEGLEARG